MNPDFTLFAGAAGLLALWSHLRAILDRVRGLFIQRTTLSGDVALTVSDYLYATAKIWRWGDGVVRSQPLWVRPRERVMEVAYETAPAGPVMCLWRRWPVVFLSPGHSGGTPGVPCQIDVLHLFTPRGMDVKHLLAQAIEWQSARETTGKRYRVHHIGGRQRQESSFSSRGDIPQAVAAHPPRSEPRPGTRYLHWTEADIGAPRPADPFASYALSEAAAQARTDFRRWLSLKAWYAERGIPWRRGHLLYGPPGTGKTALVRALAQEADMPVHAYDLSTMTNEEFTAAWQDMQESAPCIALIEDIDGVFHGRTNVLVVEQRREGLTFDCLLNALGGIQTADGVFVVVTTNQPELLDDALGRPSSSGIGTSRPGRLDVAFCLPAADDDQRASILRRILGTDAPEHVAATRCLTAAQVTEYAIGVALDEAWQPPSPISAPP